LPASDSVVAFTITMTRIVVAPRLVVGNQPGGLASIARHHLTTNGDHPLRHEPAG
jgi:hypothetical protein